MLGFKIMFHKKQYARFYKQRCFRKNSLLGYMSKEQVAETVTELEEYVCTDHLLL